eukprot:TRINITY_DN3228_c0_g2_i2.p1 TRINITY_DN3228_c0_g2~~TRINITY_DN3228_c0_g2_i2.p1  ORF type:complete len:242 (-),score=51.24 TRINITY_DN3228_c0_g2_i2:98-823(-)
MMLLFLFTLFLSVSIGSDFVSISDVDPSILLDLRYYTLHNFVGAPIMGYDQPKCLLTKEAALALASVQKIVLSMDPPYSLKVYDCYRPQMAVDQFFLWSQNPDTLMQGEFYPNMTKSVLFPEGYIAKNSSHSRGSTMDLTLVPFPPPVEEKYERGMPLFPCTAPEGIRFGDNTIDMGTGFDCFNPLAHTDNPNITDEQKFNRDLLRNAMEQGGFQNYIYEWWHYTLKNEPYPDTYFNFPIS